MLTALYLNSCSFLALMNPEVELADQTSVTIDLDDEGKQAIENAETEAVVTVEVEESDSEGEVEPEGIPEGTKAINPLSGLPVANPDNLLLPPALVSVTNFPPTARPQYGLSVSPIVFELFIGDGMTRYLAIFYGDYPDSNKLSDYGDLESDLTEGVREPVIGPIRSGRIPYEHIRKLYNGFIVMASAYSKVADQLSDYVNVFGDDRSDVNSAMMPVAEIEEAARTREKELGETTLDGMVFDETVPTGGRDAQSLWIYYSFKNQVFWRYNDEDGSYHRWQDNADGETFIEQTDSLTGEPLTYENVIVLMVDHEVDQKYFIDLDLLYVKQDKALVFRDGEVHQVYWTTKSEEYEQTTGKLRPIRFIDAEGNPFPLKPGQTWIELIPTHSPIWETVDSEKYHLLLNGRSKESGHWAVYFKIDY